MVFAFICIDRDLWMQTATCLALMFLKGNTSNKIKKAERIWEFSLETYRRTLDLNFNEPHRLVVLSRNNTDRRKTVWGHG